MKNNRCTLGPKWQAVWGRWYSLIVLSSNARPGDSVSLKALLNVRGRELGKPDESRIVKGGIRSVKSGEGSAGIARRRKRRVHCNGEYRVVHRFVTKSSASKDGRLPTGLNERESLEWPLQEVTLGGGVTH